VKPGSTSVERFVKGRPTSAETPEDLKARMDAWHAERDRTRGSKKKG